MNRPSITLNELGKGADIQVNSISGVICSNYYHIYSSIPKSRTKKVVQIEESHELGPIYP